MAPPKDQVQIIVGQEWCGAIRRTAECPLSRHLGMVIRPCAFVPQAGRGGRYAQACACHGHGAPVADFAIAQSTQARR
jgi:hypothetical protein